MKGKSNSTFLSSAKIEDVRQLMQMEMAEKGTTTVMAATGDGWEAHVRERYGPREVTDTKFYERHEQWMGLGAGAIFHYNK